MNGTQGRAMRRFDREITQEETLKIIHDAPFAVVSTVDSDGFVYAVPVNPVCVDNMVYFHTTAGDSRRNDNIRNHNQVCMTFVTHAQVVEKEYSCNYACAVVEGKCAEVIDSQEKRKALEAIVRRWAPTNDSERNSRYIDKHFDGCRVWAVAMEKVSGKARKGKTQ